MEGGLLLTPLPNKKRNQLEIASRAGYFYKLDHFFILPLA